VAEHYGGRAIGSMAGKADYRCEIGITRRFGICGGILPPGGVRMAGAAVYAISLVVWGVNASCTNQCGEDA